MDAVSAGLWRLARMPPCTLGCRVFTRPSIISGKPVTSEIPMTSRPAFARTFAVPPVDTSSQPAFARLVANGTRPVLSETLSSARIWFEEFLRTHCAVDFPRGPNYSSRLTLGGPAFSIRPHVAVFVFVPRGVRGIFDEGQAAVYRCFSRKAGK